MTFNDLLALKGFTVYSLSKTSGIAKTTIFDIASSKTNLLECTGRTLRALAKELEVSIEELLNLEHDKIDKYPEFLTLSINKVRGSIKENSNIKEIYLKQFLNCVDMALSENLISIEEATKLKKRYDFIKGSVK